MLGSACDPAFWAPTVAGGARRPGAVTLRSEVPGPGWGGPCGLTDTWRIWLAVPGLSYAGDDDGWIELKEEAAHHWRE
ncbi:hypothetical protein NDU88_000454 [Pleurodeles waltl]|uniref:Uncharacterized protein n=1 Tax=Pleurodeles waltl TaxID=8319 RepID=A0AAV7P2W2_PLEWA|nr:hypothetical protein NDU88_000454 [Pleurodeles waltl]